MSTIYIIIKWIYKNTEITTPPENSKGFVYQITDTTTYRKYIGKKNFYSITRKPPLKGKKRKRVITKESDWKKYQSSSKIVKALIKEKGEDHFIFEILSFAPDKSQLNYAELVIQVKLDVLQAMDNKGERIYLNENIALRYYPSTKPDTIEYRRQLNEEF